jgi:hypothetical protein
MATHLRGLRIRRVALVDKGANQDAFVELFKRADAQEDPLMAEKDVATQLADLQKQVAELTKAKADADAAVVKAEADKQAELKKADDLKKTAEQQAAENTEAVVALRKQLEAATDQVSKLADEREMEKYVTLAKSVPHLGKAEVAGKELRAIAKALGAEGFQEYLARQRQVASELAGSKLLKEIGTDGTGDTDPEAVVARIAKTIREKDPTLTEEQAMVRAFQSDAGKAAFRQGGTD